MQRQRTWGQHVNAKAILFVAVVGLSGCITIQRPISPPPSPSGAHNSERHTQQPTQQPSSVATEPGVGLAPTSAGGSYPLQAGRVRIPTAINENTLIGICDKLANDPSTTLACSYRKDKASTVFMIGAGDNRSAVQHKRFVDHLGAAFCRISRGSPTPSLVGYANREMDIVRVIDCDSNEIIAVKSITEIEAEAVESRSASRRSSMTASTAGEKFRTVCDRMGQSGLGTCSYTSGQHGFAAEIEVRTVDQGVTISNALSEDLLPSVCREINQSRSPMAIFTFTAVVHNMAMLSMCSDGEVTSTGWMNEAETNKFLISLGRSRGI